MLPTNATVKYQCKQESIIYGTRKYIVLEKVLLLNKQLYKPLQSLNARNFTGNFTKKEVVHLLILLNRM